MVVLTGCGLGLSGVRVTPVTMVVVPRVVEIDPLPPTALEKYGTQAERIVSILVMSAEEGVVPFRTKRMNP
jgi:hypothetical protein